MDRPALAERRSRLRAIEERAFGRSSFNPNERRDGLARWNGGGAIKLSPEKRALLREEEAGVRCLDTPSSRRVAAAMRKLLNGEWLPDEEKQLVIEHLQRSRMASKSPHTAGLLKRLGAETRSLRFDWSKRPSGPRDADPAKPSVLSGPPPTAGDLGTLASRLSGPGRKRIRLSAEQLRRAAGRSPDELDRALENQAKAVAFMLMAAGSATGELRSKLKNLARRIEAAEASGLGREREARAPR